MHSGNGQHEQHDEEQQSHARANGCAACPSVLAFRSSSSSLNSISIETSLLLSSSTNVEVALRQPCAASVSSSEPSTAPRDRRSVGELGAEEGRCAVAL